MPPDGARRLSKRLCARGTLHLLTAVPGTTQTISHMQQRRQLFEGTTAVELNAVDLLLMTQNDRDASTQQQVCRSANQQVAAGRGFRILS